MNVHTVIEDQINILTTVGDIEIKRRRLDQLPALTRAIEGAYKQALYLVHSVDLIRLVFQQEPVGDLDDAQSVLKGPLKHLDKPDDVFVKPQVELTAFQTRLEESREKLQNLAQQLGQQLQLFRQTLDQEIDTVRAVLKIPELLPENTKPEQIEQILDEMDKILKGAQSSLSLLKTDLKFDAAKNVQNLAERWTPLYSVFTTIRQQLSFDRLQKPPYEFDQKTVDLIKELVSGKTVTLDELVPLTIYELHQKNFKQFLSQVELRFTAQD
jgi:hypothetical protein